MTCWRLSAKQIAYPSPRIAYNVFNMDRKLRLIAKLPLIIGGFFLAGIKTIGAMMLPFGCNRSQPIPNILAGRFFSKNGQVKFWPDNENVGSVKKKIGYFSLTARSQQKRTMLVSIPTYFCPNF